MNRLVLIGNGFDLAHGLKTSYADFIYWYWRGVVSYLLLKSRDVYEDTLCKVTNHKLDYWNLRNLYHSENEDLYSFLVNNDGFIDIEYRLLFERINKSVQTKGWVDIENEYYELLKEYVIDNPSNTHVDELNKQLQSLQEKLIEYLCHIDISDKIKTDIRQKIYGPFETPDISVEGWHALEKHIKYGLELDEREWNRKLRQYGSDCYSIGWVDDYRKKYGKKHEAIVE